MEISLDKKVEIIEEYMREVGEPIRPKTVYKGYKIGSWKVSMTRANYNLPDNVRKRFVELGVFERVSLPLEKQVEIIEEYMREVGEPIRQETVYKGYKIGRWKDAMTNSDYNLPDNVRDKMVGLGVFERVRLPLEKQVKIIEEYIREVGEPIRRETVYKGYKIGSWKVNMTRADYDLPDNVKDRLVELGVFEPINLSLEKQVEIIEEYIREVGEPIRRETVYKGHKIGIWKEKMMYRDMSIIPIKLKRKIDELGILDIKLVRKRENRFGLFLMNTGDMSEELIDAYIKLGLDINKVSENESKKVMIEGKEYINIRIFDKLKIDEAISSLDDKGAEIIREFYGLDNEGIGLTQSGIARNENVSRQAIAEKLKSRLKMLRKGFSNIEVVYDEMISNYTKRINELENIEGIKSEFIKASREEFAKQCEIIRDIYEYYYSNEESILNNGQRKSFEFPRIQEAQDIKNEIELEESSSPFYVGIESLGLSTYTFNALKNAGYTKISDLLNLLRLDEANYDIYKSLLLASIREIGYCGKTTAKEILDKIESFVVENNVIGESEIEVNDEDIKRATLEKFIINSMKLMVIDMKLEMVDEKHDSVEVEKNLLNSDVSELSLSARGYNVLKRGGYNTLGDIIGNAFSGDSYYDMYIKILTYRLKDIEKVHDVGVQAVLEKLQEFILNNLGIEENASEAEKMIAIHNFVMNVMELRRLENTLQKENRATISIDK